MSSRLTSNPHARHYLPFPRNTETVVADQVRGRTRQHGHSTNDTSTTMLRHPEFIGVRDDKLPRAVRREDGD